MKLTGVKAATTFTGFCSYHDGSTFRPIETGRFVVTSQSAYLLAYRALCIEIHAKMYQRKMTECLRELDKGKDLDAQLQCQASVIASLAEIDADLDEFAARKSEYDDDLLAADFQHTRYLAIELESVPPVMVCGGFPPGFDFSGKVLHSADELHDPSSELELVTFSMIGTDSGGIAVFAWRGELPHARQLADSLVSVPRSRIPDVLVNFVLETFENIAVGPDWWDGLEKADQCRLLAKFPAKPPHERSTQCLVDDGSEIASFGVRRVHPQY